MPTLPHTERLNSSCRAMDALMPGVVGMPRPKNVSSRNRVCGDLGNRCFPNGDSSFVLGSLSLVPLVLTDAQQVARVERSDTRRS